MSIGALCVVSRTLLWRAEIELWIKKFEVGLKALVSACHQMAPAKLEHSSTARIGPMKTEAAVPDAIVLSRLLRSSLAFASWLRLLILPSFTRLFDKLNM